MFAVLARAIALLAIGGGLGAAINAVRPGGVRPAQFTVAQSCTANAPTGSVSVLAPAEAVRLCGDPDVLVADVRPPEVFTRGHVAGAIHLPCASSGDAVSNALAKVAGKHTLIVYGDTTAEARPVAETLRLRLPSSELKIVVIDGGFPAWDRAGLACSSGPCPECNEEHAENKR